jgi:putative peptidoglycan lipid II flippase
MNYATRLIQFPLGLVGTAISFAVLPPLSEHASALAAARAEGGRAPGPSRALAVAEALDGYRETLKFGARIVLLLMLPATVGLMALREPLVQLLFEHGRFGGAETARTALVFLAYAPQLPFTALDQLLIVAFYARKDTRTPVLVGVVTVVLYLVSALAMIRPFGVAGLALANAIQNSAHGIILLILLQRAGSGILDRDFITWTLRVVAAATAMGLVLWAAAGWVFGGAESVLVLATLLVTCAGVGGLAYLGLLEALGVRDLRAVAMVFVRRVRPAR